MPSHPRRDLELTPAGHAPGSLRTPEDRSAQNLLDHADALQARITGLQAALDHHERLATLGTIAGLIAHEFNNILTPVLSYAQMALSRPDDRELVAKALTRAAEGSERAAAIASAILGFVRDDSARSGSPKTPAGAQASTDRAIDVPRGTSARPAASAACSIELAVREALACLAREPERDGIALTLDLPPDLVAAAKPIAIQHVLLNLILNARNAMLPGGGNLCIRAWRQPVPPGPTVGGVAEVRAPRAVTTGTPTDSSSWIVVEVADTGRGMSPEQLRRAFEPYYTRSADQQASAGADRRAGAAGTGLGMTICQRLVADCGGVMIVESEPGRGTTVRIGAPAADPC